MKQWILLLSSAVVLIRMRGFYLKVLDHAYGKHALGLELTEDDIAVAGTVEIQGTGQSAPQLTGSIERYKNEQFIPLTNIRILKTLLLCHPAIYLLYMHFCCKGITVTSVNLDRISVIC